MNFDKNFDKTIALLIEYCKKDRNRNWIINLIENSDFSFSNYYAVIGGKAGTGDDYYDIMLNVEPLVYIEYLNNINDASETIQKDLTRITNLNIGEVQIMANYDRFEIIDSRIRPIMTEWEVINDVQQKMMNLFKQSDGSIDYQNIGNTSRTLMQKLAEMVFNAQIHIPSNSKINVNGSNFKNQLSTYISIELKGEKNKKLRKVAQSSIDFVSDSIDLMNKTTHSLNANKHFAELCVISAISAVSIIKIVSELKK